MEARSLYRELYDGAPVGFLSLDRRGSIVDANLLAARLLGADVARLLGRSLAAYCTERAVDTLGHHLRAAFEGIQHSCEIDVRNGADATRALRLESRVDRKGYWCWTALIDVTDQKRLIEEAQRMQAIGTFASQVAHDFNNLLTGMIGCADLALARLPEGSEAVRYLDALKSAGYSGGAIVSRLMEFGRARAESARAIDINALIARRETLLARLMGPDVQLRLGLGPSVAPALCDPAEIEQVLMNLAVNARQAMPQGGRLTLQTAESVVTGAEVGRRARLPAGRYVTIVVSDTGCGIDAETQRRIFEPFFTTKAPDRGTGLGLSTVDEIISRLGGAIQVESEPGAGTTFTVYIPWADGMVGAELEQPSIGGQRGDETVLLVEDEPLVRISVAHYLRRHGYHVLESSVDEALAVLRDTSQTVDLLLTGVVLSGVTGPHLAEIGRARRPSLRVLFMSADSHEALAGARVGPDALVLEKPFTEADIISKVRAVLRGSSHLPPRETLPGTTAAEPRDVSVTRNE